jgi:hypothetical protein
MISADNQDLGAESLLGPDADEDAQTLRDRLALATRYLANWYKATKDSAGQAVWWQRIDAERTKVEAAYSELAKQENTYFAGRIAKAYYMDAAAGWPQLWRDLKLSADTLPDPSLLDSAADLLTTIAHTPSAAIADVGNEIGKAIGGSLGNLWRQAWPWLLVAGGVGVVYMLRKPLALAASKAVAA